MRIGQTIWNAMAKGGKWEAPEANPLFYISDEDFISLLKGEEVKNEKT